MAGPGLLVNNDTTYPDDGSDPSVHLHQTDHDTIHGIVNHIDKDTPPAGNGQVWVSISGVMTPRALVPADVGSAPRLTDASVISAVGPTLVAINTIVPISTASNAVGITLPTTPADGSRVVLKLVTQTGINAVTVTAGGSDVFNKAAGVTTKTLVLLNQAITLQYAATPAIWYVVGDDLALASLDARYSTALGIVRTSWYWQPQAAVTIGNANSTRYYRVSEGGTISKVRVGIVAQAGNIAVAAYSNAGIGLSALPGTRLATSGTTSCPSPGINDISLGGSVTLNPGDWLALGADGTGATFEGFTGYGNLGLATGLCGSSADYPPPSPAGTLTASNNRLVDLLGVP